MDAGENIFGFSPKVMESLNISGCFNYYPDPEYKELRYALERYTGINLKNIIVGSGSDELIDLLLRLVLNVGDKIINCPPTFGMYPILTTLNRGVIVSVPRNSDFSLNIKQIKEKIDDRTKIIFVCSPNNPTGTITNKKEIVALLETGKLVVVDEAYYEFYGKTITPLLSKYENLIILRTFSKWAGIAGLRLGYGLMSEYLVKELFKFKSPYNVNMAADLAGKAILKDLKTVQANILKICQERDRIEKELDKLSIITFYPSCSNQIFIKIRAGFSKLQKLLEEKKIAVRYFDSELTGQAVRLSIGKPDQNNKVLAVFKEFQKNQETCDSIIFDMDGVLVDVSNSYRLAIKNTTEYVLKNRYKIKKIVQSEDIDAMKKIPGFNNDWNLSFELIRLLSIGKKRKDFLKNAKIIAKQNNNAYQAVKDIFQGYYLGTKRFYEVYKRKSPVSFPDGFITNERLLIDRNLLKALSRKYVLGIATSRPRFEALFALKNLEIAPIIIKEEFIVAQEDALREKPSPDPLFEAKRRMKVTKPVYVGDSINDVIASQKAKMKCIFIGKDKLGNIQISKVNEIAKIFL